MQETLLTESWSQTYFSFEIQSNILTITMMKMMIIADRDSGGGDNGDDVGHYITNMKLSNEEKIKHDIFQED